MEPLRAWEDDNTAFRGQIFTRLVETPFNLGRQAPFDFDGPDALAGQGEQ